MIMVVSYSSSSASRNARMIVSLHLKSLPYLILVSIGVVTMGFPSSMRLPLADCHLAGFRSQPELYRSFAHDDSKCVPRRRQSQGRRFSPLKSARGKYFQLEEMEDAETSISEVFMHCDNRVEIGETDGPVFNGYSGSWEDSLATEGGTKGFQMILRRVYPGGRDPNLMTDMGKFQFEVERVFSGEYTIVGSKLAVSGTMHRCDKSLGDEKVGYFQMIDTTEERLGQ